MHQINASNPAASRSELWPKENSFHDSGTEEDDLSMVNSSDSVSNVDHDDSVSHNNNNNNMSRTEYFTEDNLSNSPHSQPNNDHHSSSPSWPTVNLLSEKADHPPHPHDKLNYTIINSSPETLAPRPLNQPSTPNSNDQSKEELDQPLKKSRLHKNSGTSRRTRKSSGRNGPITLKIRKVTKYRRKADGLDESYDFYQVLGGPKANQGKTNANGPSKQISKENPVVKNDRKRKVLDSQVSNNDQGSGRLKPYTLSTLSSTVQSCADLEVRDLPKDILLRIFRTIVMDDESKALSNLLSLSQVAEEWRQVILSNETLWKTIDFSCLKPTSITELLEFCKLGVLDHATHLNLSGWSDAITANVFPQILKRCGQNLKSISLRECYNTNGQTISLLEEHCPHLEELDLSRVSDTYAQSPNKKAKNGSSPTLLFPNRFQQFLTKNGSRLKGLTLSENKIFKINVVVDAIVEHCNNLQSLDLSNIISHSSFTLSLETLQESCPKLKVLRLGNIHIKPPKGPCTGFPLLEELSIPCNNSDTGHLENVISSFTHSAENLKLLDIRGSSKVTSSCLIKIPAWNLQHLAIDNCLAIFANGLDMVVSKWKHSLIELDVSQNNHQEGISAALEQISAEKNSPLESITLRGSSVSFESVSKLVMNCSNLKMIDLQSCRALPRGTKRVFRDQEIQEFRDEISKGSYL